MPVWQQWLAAKSGVRFKGETPEFSLLSLCKYPVKEYGSDMAALGRQLAVGHKKEAQVHAMNLSFLDSIVAEGEGFEPPEGSHLQRFSRPPRSTALPPLRRVRALALHKLVMHSALKFKGGPP